MILLYHSVLPDGSPPGRFAAGQALPRSAFERQLRWLADHYRIISLAEYIAEMGQPGFYRHRPIAITFDDGFGITFQAVSQVFIDRNIPVALFLATRHLDCAELLWFSYLKALCFEGLYKVVTVDRSSFPLQTVAQSERAWDGLRKLARASGDPSDFCRALSETYPLDPHVAVLYAGMTREQVRVASESGLMELGAHTATHPYLPHLSKADQSGEILESRRILSGLTGKSVRYFAYPSGEYDQDTLELVKAAGFEAAFAVIPRRMGGDGRFEMGRVGIYSPSLLKLQLKTLGVAALARHLGLRVG